MYYLQLKSDNTGFHNLSVKDLIEARDTFHIHLMNKRNVIATAIGRYRVRKSDFNKEGAYEPQKQFPKKARTLENSIVTEFSWPCVLVFVSKWEDETQLINDEKDNIIPKCIYMPDGRVVPICVVEEKKVHRSDTDVNDTKLVFPQSYISGGYPLIVNSQGQKRIASMGCLVSDGNKVFALTNKHVTGKEGTEIFTKFRGKETRIGVSSKQFGKEKFTTLYPGWQGSNLVVNTDVGLVEVDDLNIWKTEVFGIGELKELTDLNTTNISLELIDKKVKAFGAVSGKIEGKIIGLFYRYKSVGGTEYVSDFLIGGADNKPLNVHHGDSGTLWLIQEGSTKEYKPFALQWGQHQFMEGNEKKTRPYALASSLSNILRELDLDLVRGWNVDQEYSWGKFGHFKIGARACEMVTNQNLGVLLKANEDNIGYPNEVFKDPSGFVKAGTGEFVPLADVPDLVWRPMKGTKGVARNSDESNHFADMDDFHPKVMGGKTLLQLNFNDEGKIRDEFFTLENWLKFYSQLDDVKPNYDKDGKLKRRLGGLPFRVWQMYDIMVYELKKNKDIAKFICAGGTMSHYVGDACQALHISYKHHGLTENEYNVHKDYEDNMLNNKKNIPRLLKGIDSFDEVVRDEDLFKTGLGAAKAVLKLMWNTFQNLPPDNILKAWRSSSDMEDMFKKLGEKTIANINQGCLTMATIWQSAWIEGEGDKIDPSELVAVGQDELISLYSDKSFVPSFPLDKLELNRPLSRRKVATAAITAADNR